MSEKREAALASGTSLPWYYDVLPEKGINLGLDLRGGLYLEFEVETAKAIENRVDVLVDDIKAELGKNNVVTSEIRQEVKTQSIEIFASDANAIEATREIVQKNFANVLAIQKHENNHLSFVLDESHRDYLLDHIIKQALEKVRNRIDRYGVAEPSIQRLGNDRIAVELPGIKDPERAIGMIKRAGMLEFKLVDASVQAADLASMLKEARESLKLAEDDFSLEAKQSINEQLAKKLPQDTEISFSLNYDPLSHKLLGGTPYLLTRRAALTGQMLKSAQTNINNNEPFVSITFDAQGTTKFGDLTKNNVGKQLAILLDGVVNSAPLIREPILGGRAQIEMGRGNFRDILKQCEDLVLVLNEGALPATLTEATKTIVGPSLGADSIKQGVSATLLGALCVFVFMVLYYRGSGLIANVALAINLLFIMAALALFQATLTLPGIAGIVLTLGMAVDANVLIFERIREELKKGNLAKAAINAGYGNAIRTITDANITTLITGIVLYQFGTGPIKGFAVTLIIGLVISMYTAIVCTRMAYDYFLIKKRITKVSV